MKKSEIDLCIFPDAEIFCAFSEKYFVKMRACVSRGRGVTWRLKGLTVHRHLLKPEKEQVFFCQFCKLYLCKSKNVFFQIKNVFLKSKNVFLYRVVPQGLTVLKKDKNKQEPSSYKPHFPDLGSLALGMHY